MSYFLKHHFDPDQDSKVPKPKELEDGSVDHHDLNLLQNVEVGSVLAEWEDLENVEGEADPRFVYEDKVFPAGRGTGIRRNDKNHLFAAVNGNVGYLDGKIVVDEEITIVRDVDFHIGNVNFIGNLTVGGSVRSGFMLQGRDIAVQGQVEGAHIEALRDLRCRGGVKGSKQAFLESGMDMKLSFCEYATLKSGGDIMVKGTLMHSNVYCGRRLAVGGRLTGGDIFCHEYIYVGEQLGGGLDTDTSLTVGYDSTLIYADAEYNRRIKKLYENIKSYEKVITKNKELRAEIGPKLDAAQREYELLKMLKAKLWEGIHGTEQIENCKILVPGVVKPGVEISIGSAYLKIDDFLEDVYFYYENGEVRIGTSARKLKR
ncbi:FapA family protein [Pseudodesulfovibrio sp.]|uniref:FapA family protein n=1 Tax=unclassified Pseudodesulfovibrio TaxID=2661612 RepID=UPI003B008AE9